MSTSAKKSKEHTAVINKLSAANEVIKTKDKEIAKQKSLADQAANKAEIAERRERIACDRARELEVDAGKRCNGDYAVRTAQPRRDGSKTHEAGELLGYFTPVDGIEPRMMVDAVRYKTAKIEKTPSCDEEKDSAITLKIEELKSKLEQSEADLKVKDEQVKSLAEKLEASVIEIEKLNATIAQMQAKFAEMNDGSDPEVDDKDQLTFDDADQKDSNTKTKANTQSKGTGQAKKKS